MTLGTETWFLLVKLLVYRNLTYMMMQVIEPRT